MCCWCPPLGVPGCCYAHSALCGGLAMVGNGSPHGRRSLGLNFVLEGSSGLSGHGIGEQLLLLSATWVSCSLGLLLSSLGVSAQKDHRKMEKKKNKKTTIHLHNISHRGSGRAAPVDKPMISSHWETLIHLRSD